MDAHERAVATGWLRTGEAPLLSRLRFPLGADLPDVVFDENRTTRDAVLAELLSGDIVPADNPSCLGDSTDDDVLIGEVDRYGFPLRTVLSRPSGLLRSDPYYPPGYLQRFYSTHYRNLYRPRKHSDAYFIADQIQHGQRILVKVRERLGSGARVLDIGCGMGGMLVPFRWEGCTTLGCDYDAAYLARGRELGLDLRNGGVAAVAGEGPFDLIILSHVLEHAIDPIALARQAAALLAPGGIVYVEVPGFDVIDRWYDGDLLTYLQNAHLWHFTQKTLAAVLARAGLGVQQSDPLVWCIAARCADNNLQAAHAPQEGERVLSEILRLERSLQARRQEA